MEDFVIITKQMALFLYDFSDYKAYLEKCVTELRGGPSRLTFAALAKQAKINRSYLSQVIKGDAHLSSDQLELITSALGLAEDDRDYLLLLLDIERTQIKERRARLESKAHELRREKLKSQSFLKTNDVAAASSAEAAYYQDPYCSLTHMFLTIPTYATAPQLLAEKMGISEAHLARVLQILCSAGVIEKKGDVYEIQNQLRHLEATNPLAQVHRTLMRLKGLDVLARQSSDRDYFLSTSFSANERVRESIRRRFLDFLKSVSEDVERTKDVEEVFHINFDLFKV